MALPQSCLPPLLKDDDLRLLLFESHLPLQACSLDVDSCGFGVGVEVLLEISNKIGEVGFGSSGCRLLLVVGVVDIDDPALLGLVRWRVGGVLGEVDDLPA